MCFAFDVHQHGRLRARRGFFAARNKDFLQPVSIEMNQRASSLDAPRHGLRILPFGLMLITILLAAGCGGSGSDSDSDSDSEMTSTLGDNDSHRAGQNCQSCHRPGGSGDGVFTVAGTVFDGNNPSVVKPDVIVRLHGLADENSALVEEIEVDAKGNFYTTATIPFGTGLYAVVVEGAASSPFMSTPVTSSDGACNSCHDGNMVIYIN